MLLIRETMIAMIARILFLSLLLCLVSTLSADIIRLDESLKTHNILKNAQVYIDADGNKNVEEVLNNPSLFTPFKAEKIKLGYTNKHVWVKFSIENNTPQTLLPVLEIDNPMLDYIHLYTFENNRVSSQITKGVLVPIDFQGALNFNFELSVTPNSTKEYFLHVSSITCGLYFNATLMSQQELFSKELTHQLVLALFFGLMIGLVIYNTFLYFFTKDKLYLYYVLFQLLILFNHASYTTFTRHVFAQWWAPIDAFLAVYYIIGSLMFMLLFTHKFLQLQHYKTIENGMKFLGVIGLVILFVSSTYIYLLDMATYLIIVVGLYLISISIYLAFQNHPHAKYFIVGWGVAIGGDISIGFYQMGIWSPMSEIRYFYEATVIFEALLFSIILAQRLKHTKALENALGTQKVLTQELHHRVKNNMQLILSLYRLKFADVKDGIVKNKLLECETNIVAMSTVHQALYTQDNLYVLDTQEFFQKLLQSLEASYHNENIEISLKCTVSLSPQKAIHCGIILNELITNSLKYAFTEGEKGTIDIALYAKEGKIVFHVQDNGKGYDQNKKCSSFGLVFVKALAQDELHATLNIDSKNRTSYLMTWSK